MTQAFDFAALDLASACDKPFEFELKHPATGEGLGVFLSVVGSESATFQAYARDTANKARRRRFEDQKRGKDEVATVEDEERVLVDAVVACVKDWRTVKDGKSEPVIYLGGAAMEFSAENARRILGHPGYVWAVRQVNAATGDLSNFTQA